MRIKKKIIIGKRNNWNHNFNSYKNNEKYRNSTKNKNYIYNNL